MADKEAIKKAILESAGNPSVGVIADMADRMAEAVAKLDKPNQGVKFSERVSEQKETRVLAPGETR
jgi:hypothetical protein